MIEDLQPLILKLSGFAKSRFKFVSPPRLFLKQNRENEERMLGKTAYYDPAVKAITIFISGRHPKDVLRSFAHELVHHAQNLRGDLFQDKINSLSQNYAQEDEHMRNMEKEAYLQGNMCFRDWEDSLEDKEKYIIQIAEQKFLRDQEKQKMINENSTLEHKGEKKVSKKITKEMLRDRISKLVSKKMKLNEKEEGIYTVKSGDSIWRIAKALGVSREDLRATNNIEGDVIHPGQQLKIPSGGQGGGSESGSDAITRLRNAFASPEVAGSLKKLQGPLPGDAEDEAWDPDTVAQAADDAVTIFTARAKTDWDPIPGLSRPDQAAVADMVLKLHAMAEESQTQVDKIINSVRLNIINLKNAASVTRQVIKKEGKKTKKLGNTTNPTREQKEFKLKTSEDERALYESRFTPRNNRLFDKLKEKWTK